MPAASRLDKEPADTDPDQARGPADPVIAAERLHLTRSRKFLRLMREDVLSLRALGGDPVSEEYLKADLYRRAEALRDLPDTPLFFGRLDYHRSPWEEQPLRARPARPGPARRRSTSDDGTCTTRAATRW